MENIVMLGLAVPTLAAEDDLGRIARGAAEGQVPFAFEAKDAWKLVVAIGQKDRCTRSDALDRCE
jgi:hypothetical protein